MKTKNMIQEQISAFADGELADDQVDALLTVLRGREGRSAWDAYHQIGDVLRSDDLALDMSPDFSARLTARLEQEPTILALTVQDLHAVSPASALGQDRRAVDMTHTDGSNNARRSFGKKFLFASSAVAAAAAMVFVAAPPLMVALNGGGKDGGMGKGAITAQNDRILTASAAHGFSSSASTPAATIAAVHDGQMLRDERIDEYLAAHQRFSPSVYSTAQYTRSAAFVGDSEK